MENKFIRSLVQSAQQGKIVAFEELIEMNKSRIYAITLRLSGSHQFAPLLMFNVITHAYEQLQNIRPDISFAEWLRSIAVYNTLSELSTGELAKDKKMKKLFKGFDSTDDFFTEQLENAISRLTNDERMIFVLNKIENYSLEEIADLINLSGSQAENKLTDGLNKIINSVDNINSETDLQIEVSNLPKEKNPDGKIIELALESIRNVKLDEIKEIESVQEEIEEIPERVEIEKKAEKVKEKRGKVKIKINWKIVLAGVAVIIIAGAYYLTSETNDWTVTIESGAALLNEQNIQKREKFSPGDIISTDSDSKVLIEVADVGTVELLPNSSFKRLDKSYSAKLLDGKININTQGASEYFRIEIPSAIIEEFYMGTNYSVQEDVSGNSLIELNEGWLRVVFGEEETIFPEQYNLEILKSSGPSIPYYSGSPSEYTTLIQDYMFGSKGNIALYVILDASSERDGITLWNLLQKVRAAQRSAVYEKLYELVPHPDDLEKKNILNLDADMLQIWLDEIEWLM
jgi:RNA polymerase sigma-70 factor (ECF subfamily)